ncbi:peptidylprolyl isomerase [Sphingomonas rhizophila]|uniref:Parvulin-like PPIase n=1 Tax=Sphingomonas rhizophila TaxID=2071607 RepID=A0A7G9SDP7_9SPHN|nr:peptidylprolyl isomerase [Sphingomonas rhizophila]QNN65972.1 peptidylprolyl isomerase [Sphingomonas rhizophila]
MTGKLLSKRSALLMAGIGLAAATTAAVSQTAAPPADSAANLRLPSNPTIYGAPLPQVVKATVIVNGEVITQTDIDQRVALLAIANGESIPAEEMERLRQQVLRNLVDETLQIQAARAEEIEIKPADIDRTITRVAGNLKQSPEQLAAYLAANGSSIRSIRRQIEGEIAWRRLQSAKIESGVSVGEDEVKAVIAKLEASKGTQEYRVGEIFLSSTAANHDEVKANAGKILAALRQGGSFAAYARQYSQSTTAAVGGDLGWVRPEQLPAPLDEAVKELGNGAVSVPIDVPGGVSIIAVQDTRSILSNDPRNAVLNLKQVSITFPKGTTRAQAEARVASFAQASRSIGGCGGAEKLATDFQGDVVQSDQVKLRELPPALQEMMLPMQIGQATRPFGNLEEGVRVLVMCGRDEVASTLPTFDQVYSQINEERVNMRARRYLRDLRRDAVIDFR